MKPKELRDLSDPELRQKVSDLSQEIFHLRIQKSTGQVKNVARISLLRKDIARTQTILRERAAGQKRSSGEKRS